MHVLGDDNKLLAAGIKVRCGMYNRRRLVRVPRRAKPERKNAHGGGRGQRPLQEWRERKTGIEYRPPLSRSLALLQLLTNG